MAASRLLRRIVVGGCVAALASPARPATFIVDVTTDSVDASPGDGLCADAAAACSLRAAILEANALPGSDVVMLPAGTFELAIRGAGEDVAATGDLDVTESLAIEGAARDLTVIDGWDLRGPDPSLGDRVLDIRGGAALTLRDLTITGGRGTQGGGMRVDASALDATDVAIVRNAASEASGVLSESSIVTFSRVLIADNHGNYWGPGTGGGLLIDGGFVTMTESVVADHQLAAIGAAIAMRGGTLVLRDTTVRDNSAEFGGGLALGIDAPADPPTVTIERSTIAGNRYAREGGGIMLETGSLVMRNSTVVGNDATRGGGLHVGASAVATLSNVTIAGNMADGDFVDGGGGGVMVEPGGRVTAANLLVGDNTCDGAPGSVGADWQGEMISLGHNLVESPSTTIVLGDMTGVILGRDPGLRMLRDNGGPTSTIMLSPASPAIDAGNPLAPGGGDPACEGTDQRLVGRPFGVACDLGAVEHDCFDAVDSDGDGIGDACDACPLLGDPDQLDLDGDGEGDACDADDDDDGITDVVDDCPRAPNQGDFWDRDGIDVACDNCPIVSNASQDDQDADGTGDACDNCPQTPSPGQQDHDNDGIGDACDTCTDEDGDGLGAAGLPASTCPIDNCTWRDNPLQEDADGDGIGDPCDFCTEPSAVDLSRLAEPLRVTKVAGGPLRLAWWVPRPQDVDVYRGTIPATGTMAARAASGPSAYDHEGFGACSLTVTEVDVTPIASSEYFLVGAHCWTFGSGFTTGSLGRDSLGSEIPPALNPCP